jgi:hypothetical protein
MERSQLDRLLAIGGTEVLNISRSALSAGAVFKVEDDAIPVEISYLSIVDESAMSIGSASRPLSLVRLSLTFGHVEKVK